MCVRVIRVSASTKNKYSPRAARAPAFRAAAIWRRLIRMTFAPACEAISGVASADASSTTITSHGCAAPEAAARIAPIVAESSSSSLYAGMTTEIIVCEGSILLVIYRYARRWLALHRSLRIEFNARLLHFAVRQKPDQRLVVKIDNLNAIAPRIAKIAAERRLEFQFVFFCEFLANFRQLRFIANHDPEMPHIRPLHFFDFENGEELVLAQFEEGIALAAAHMLEIENVFVKRDRLLDVVHLDDDMITSIDLHTHVLA